MSVIGNSPDDRTQASGKSPTTTPSVQANLYAPIQLRDLINLLVSGRVVIAATTLFALAVGAAYCLLVPPTYKGDGMVQVEENQKSGAGSTSSDLSAMFLGSPVETEGEIELLRSRLVLNPVIAELNLLIDAKPRYFPVIGRALARWRSAALPVSAPPLLGRFAWGGERISVTSLNVPYDLINRQCTLRAAADGFQLLDPSGQEILKGKTGELATGTYRGEAVDINVETLQARPGTEFKITRYSKYRVLEAIYKNLLVAEQGRQSGIIKIEYYGTSPAQVSAFVDHLESAYLQQNVERRSADVRKSLDFLDAQLPDQKKQVDEAKRRLAEYQLQHSSVSINEEISIYLKTAESLETEKRTLEQQKLEQLTRFSPTHSTVRAIDDQLHAIQADQDKLKSQTSSLPPTQQEYLLLLTDANVESQLYAQMLNSIQEMKVAEAGTVGNVRVVDEPLDPSDPFKPTSPLPGLILPLAVLLGLISGVGYVLVKRLLLRGIDDPADLERFLNLTTYAMIPYSLEQRKLSRTQRKHTSGDTVGLLATTDSASPVIEAIRSLRTGLHFSLLDAANSVIMFTGPTPQVGKSFVVTNLAAVLALSGKRVVVVDADLRRGVLHRNFSMDVGPGISDYVAGDAEESKIIRKSGLPGLDIISRGTSPPHPAELLMHERFADLIRRLSGMYDQVLIDTPPLLAVTDATIIGRLAGSTMLVLKSATHPLREIEESLNRLRIAGVQVKGAVLNQVGAQLGTYGYGNYGYKYYRYDN